MLLFIKFVLGFHKKHYTLLRKLSFGLFFTLNKLLRSAGNWLFFVLYINTNNFFPRDQREASKLIPWVGEFYLPVMTLIAALFCIFCCLSRRYSLQLYHTRLQLWSKYGSIIALYTLVNVVFGTQSFILRKIPMPFDTLPKIDSI